MMHKKNVHPGGCRPCERFASGDCTRGDKCWNTHTNKNSEQGFQQEGQAKNLP